LNKAQRDIKHLEEQITGLEDVAHNTDMIKRSSLFEAILTLKLRIIELGDETERLNNLQDITYILSDLENFSDELKYEVPFDLWHKYDTIVEDSIILLKDLEEAYNITKIK